MIHWEPTDREDRKMQKAKLRDMWEGIREERRFREQLGLAAGTVYRIKAARRPRMDPVKAWILGVYGVLTALGICQLIWR